MNNPFTSGKDIFGTISRPKPKQPQSNITNDNQSGISKPNDLNFRSQFRNTNNSNSNNIGRGSQRPREDNYNIKDNYTSSYQNQKQVYKPQYEDFDPKQYKKQSSNGPKGEQKITFGNPMTSQDSQKNAKVQLKPFVYNRNVYDNQFSSDASSFQTQLYSQSALSNQKSSKFQRQTSNKFDGEKSSGAYQQNPPNINRYQNKNNQINYQQQKKFEYQSRPSKDNTNMKQLNSLNMSPIGQVSKHKFDHVGDTSSFMNLDGLGDDIDRLLANSKNHEELCRLIGMEGSSNNNMINKEKPTFGYESKQTYERKQEYQSKQNYNSKKDDYINQSQVSYEPNKYNNQQNYQNQKAPQNSGYKQGARNNMVNTKGSFPNQKNLKRYQTHEEFYTRNQDQYRPNNQFARSQQNDQPQKANYRTDEFDGRKQNNIQKYRQSSNYQQSSKEPEQVFNYESSEIPVQNLLLTKRQNKNLMGNDLEDLINRQMKKMYQNGKTRLFLSATDRIETVKYDLQPL